MKVTFRKRRYYKGKWRKPGETIDMDYRYARAFIRTNAVVPAVTQAKKKPPKRTQPVATEQTTAEETTTETAVEEQEVVQAEEVKEEAQVDQVEQAEVEEEQAEEENDDKPSEFAPEPEEEQGENEELRRRMEELEEVTYRELQKRCHEENLPASGTKPELVQRLINKDDKE